MPPAGQLGRRHGVPLAAEPELELALGLGLDCYPLREAVLGERPYRPLLHEPGTRPALDEISALRFQQHAVHAAVVQPVCHHEPGGTGPDDNDGGVREDGKSRGHVGVPFGSGRGRRPGERRPESRNDHSQYGGGAAAAGSGALPGTCPAVNTGITLRS